MGAFSCSKGVVGHNPRGEGHRTRKNAPKRARSFVFGGVGSLKRRRTQKTYPFGYVFCVRRKRRVWLGRRIGWGSSFGCPGGWVSVNKKLLKIKKLGRTLYARPLSPCPFRSRRASWPAVSRSGLFWRVVEGGGGGSRAVSCCNQPALDV